MLCRSAKETTNWANLKLQRITNALQNSLQQFICTNLHQTIVDNQPRVMRAWTFFHFSVAHPFASKINLSYQKINANAQRMVTVHQLKYPHYTCQLYHTRKSHWEHQMASHAIRTDVNNFRPIFFLMKYHFFKKEDNCLA